MKLDIGCGLNIMKPVDEWTHLDCDNGPHIELVCDFGKIPLEDNSVDEIRLGDVIEHIPVWRWVEVLQEWRRILKPKGKLWGTTPNIDHAVNEYYNQRITIHELWQVLYGDRAGYPHQHYQTFNPERLQHLLQDNGFINVDMSGSPGDPKCPWWIVFECVKL
jgi:predicted SAM-dependent methyltransferase